MALIAIEAGVEYRELAAGAVMEIAGGWFGRLAAMTLLSPVLPSP